MASSFSGRARWVVAGLAAAVTLCLAALVATSSARADPWWAETTQTSVTTGGGAPDVLDRWIGNQQAPAVQVVTVPVGTADSGFQVDWASIGIGVGAVLVVALAVASAFVAVRHGGHGGPGRPIAPG
jgi:hypothetical protein